MLNRSIPVLAKSENMENGYAYNNASYSGGLRCCDAGTVNERDGEYASLYLRTTYDDGTEDEYWSGITYGSAHKSTDWEWAEDYYSIHELHKDRTSGARDYTTLSDS